MGSLCSRGEDVSSHRNQADSHFNIDEVCKSLPVGAEGHCRIDNAVVLDSF